MQITEDLLQHRKRVFFALNLNKMFYFDTPEAIKSFKVGQCPLFLNPGRFFTSI